jgi:Rrf2 family protein
MLSSKTKYALRAVLRLAENAPAGIWLQTNEVAEQEQVPRKFLEAIFVQLRDHGIIESRRGAQGGHRLLRDPAEVSVADVIRVLDGPLALTPCASRTRFRQCADCVDISECRLQPLMQQARDAVAEVLENCSLAQLASTQRAGTRPVNTRTQKTGEASASERFSGASRTHSSQASARQ